jgi:hypothetical protein
MRRLGARLRLFRGGAGSTISRQAAHARRGAAHCHLRKMIDDRLLKENEIGDRVKVARIVQKLLDTGLGLPDRSWHEWDDWAKGLE